MTPSPLAATLLAAEKADPDSVIPRIRRMLAGEGDAERDVQALGGHLSRAGHPELVEELYRVAADPERLRGLCAECGIAPRRGRPRVPTAEKRVGPKLSLKPHEIDRLDALAAAAGMTRSAYVRARLLNFDSADETADGTITFPPLPNP